MTGIDEKPYLANLYSASAHGHAREMLKNAVLAFFSSQSENAISALLHFSTAKAVEK
jgi:hypothetical protein